MTIRKKLSHFSILFMTFAVRKRKKSKGGESKREEGHKKKKFEQIAIHYGKAKRESIQ